MFRGQTQADFSSTPSLIVNELIPLLFIYQSSFVYPLLFIICLLIMYSFPMKMEDSRNLKEKSQNLIQGKFIVYDCT